MLPMGFVNFRVDNGRICQEMPVSEAQDSGGNLRA